jgi:hypothetical protein
MRAALAYLGETQPREQCDPLARFQDRDPGHSNDYGTRPDELGLQLRLAILEQHGGHLARKLGT